MKNTPLPTLIPELTLQENLLLLGRKDESVRVAVLLAAVDFLHLQGEDKLAENIRRRVEAARKKAKQDG